MQLLFLTPFIIVASATFMPPYYGSSRGHDYDSHYGGHASFSFNFQMMGFLNLVYLGRMLLGNLVS